MLLHNLEERQQSMFLGEFVGEWSVIIFLSKTFLKSILRKHQLKEWKTR